ncbi:MAG: rod shape-determining protein RodA [Candidatus Omnitrophota bacterium]
MNRLGLKILIIAITISIIGVFSIYSSTYQKDGEFWQVIYQRQLLWVMFGCFLFLLMANFNYRRLWDWNPVLYIAAVLLLLLVFILGITRLGAQRWLHLGGFNFQPSEIVKLVMAIFLARYFSKKGVDDISLKASKFGVTRAVLVPFIFIAVPVGLIIEQPDLGSGTIIFLLFLVMLYFSNVRLKYFIMIIVLFAASFPFVWHYLRDYQKDRILVFLNPNIDPLGAGYTIIQSKIAIGSGGIFGKGWLAGTQSQLHFLPESHTDFIFATFSEQWGLFGGVILLLLYFLLIFYGIKIAENTRDHFGRLLALAISLILGIQVSINIAMNMGFAPVVGIPLPLMSYGGSSICMTYIALGLLASISKRRAVF